VAGSVSVTLRKLFTVEMRCPCVLGRLALTGGSDIRPINKIAASTPQIAARFFIRVADSAVHRIVVTCFNRCQSEL